MTRISPVAPELPTLDKVACALTVQAPEPAWVTLNVFVAMVIVALRCEKPKGAAEIVMVRDPFSDENGPRFPTTSQGAFDAAVQVQVLGKTTLTFCAAPVESKASGNGETTGCWQDAPACMIVNDFSATRIPTLRGVVSGLGGTVALTDMGEVAPTPKVWLVTPTPTVSALTNHGQPAGRVNVNENVPPMPASGAAEADKVVVQLVVELRSILATTPEPPVVPVETFGGEGWRTPPVVG
jgi:hypothetical protein